MKRLNVYILIVGVVLMAAGGGVALSEFSNSENVNGTEVLGHGDAITLGMRVERGDIGFYTVKVESEYNRSVLSVEISGPGGEKVSERDLRSKMTVNFFDPETDGEYLLKVTNTDDTRNNEVHVELGRTKKDVYSFSGASMLTGILLTMIYFYLRMSRYRTAHPSPKKA